MLGQLSRKDSTAEGNNAAVFIDFEGMRSRKCEAGDKEPWYARKTSGKECVMGHKVDLHILKSERRSRYGQQWYLRRKPDADCYMGEKFRDPVQHEEDCPCEEEDYEW
jgi:hypothetical protein